MYPEPTHMAKHFRKRRVEQHLSSRVRWVKMMDFAEERIAASLA